MVAPILQPVVLAGGSGTRLWPLSREHKPKQFLPLSGEASMLQQTLQRLDGLSCQSPLIICNEQHRFLAAEQLRQIGTEDASILLEPCGRNTAPALALAALHAMVDDNDPLLLVLAADHIIQNVPAFHQAVLQAAILAGQGKLVTFGIVPVRAETGYGYIECGDPIGEFGASVHRFVEKPDAKHAAEYMASEQHFWNSGMFMFRASVYLQELEKYQPVMLAACHQALTAATCDMDFVRIDKAAFEACPSDSIDYAVMEHTDAAAMVALDAGWNDVGAWSALLDVLEKDENGNALRGDVLAEQTANTLVRADSRLVATVGVQDLVVVETKDAVLVAHKDRVQDVRQIVQRLRDTQRTEHINHREVYRPWGLYDSIDQGHRYQVKRITVKPGAKLSVQMHHHRAEHWVVVSGTAKVTNGDKTYIITENQSSYIPIGQTHSLENPGVIPLELIEVQSGSYLGEDDIVRFKDQYGRA